VIVTAWKLGMFSDASIWIKSLVDGAIMISYSVSIENLKY
jgi:hypothetical protein